MSSTRDFRIAARLGALTALAMFGLIVLGSVVRTTGSGLACPDWPLCQGRLIPPLQFNVLIEWSHRAAALLVSLLLAATVAWTLSRRETRARLGALAVSAAVLLLVQVLLGALTVWKLLDPTVVNMHLAVALLLFVAVIGFTASADRRSEPETPLPAGLARPPALLPLFALVTTMVFAQAVLGGTVSSRHAGLACPDWPACNGEWFPPLGTLAGLQMLHRAAGYLLLAGVLAAAAASRLAPAPRGRAGAGLAAALTVAQVVLGVCNVLLGTPVWLSALHLAAAAALLGLMVILTFRLACLPAREAALAARPAS